MSSKRISPARTSRASSGSNSRHADVTVGEGFADPFAALAESADHLALAFLQALCEFAALVGGEGFGNHAQGTGEVSLGGERALFDSAAPKSIHVNN